MESRLIKRVGQIGVTAKNFERAVAFYHEKLELDLLFNTGSLAFFDCDGLRLLVSLPENEEFAQASSIIYLQVDDIEKSYHHLKKKEVAFMDEPHLVAKVGQTETWMAFFKDSEDNTLALMSEVEV